jgi:hypothetical protein
MPGRYGGTHVKPQSLGCVSVSTWFAFVLIVRGRSFMTGVILTLKMGHFERVLFRALRGNMFMKHAAVEESLSDPVSVRWAITAPLG